MPSTTSAASSFEVAFERLVARVAGSLPAEEVLALHRAFEERTGAFGPEDPWFESRSRAFWDDVLTRKAFPDAALDGLPDGERLWADALRRSHRGLFTSRTEDGSILVSDVLSGVELVIHEADAAMRDSLAGSPCLFDGTVVALQAPVRTALLPGAMFHPEGVEDAVSLVVAAARARGLDGNVLLDALLRMELSLRTLSRVKPAYAYRVEALPTRST